MDWSEKLAMLPAKPGVYLMKDRQGQIIYVGKAKVLKNRVRSYFVGAHDTKTQTLVRNIADFEYIVTDTVAEALLLEANLVKQHMPIYNIKLKDDKAYPYLKVTREEHPRIVLARRTEEDGALYFGPFPNATAARQTKALLDRIYPLRKCRTLPKQPCLYYQLGECLAPCIHTIAPEQYSEIVEGIRRFMNGGANQVRQQLEQQMRAAADKQAYEKAAELRNQISALDAVMEDQKVITQDRVDRDVIGTASSGGREAIQILHIRQGRMVEREAELFDIYEQESDALGSFLVQFYTDGHAVPTSLVLPAGKLSQEEQENIAQLLHTRIHVPKRGLLKQLVKLAGENAEIALQNDLRARQREAERTGKALTELAMATKLPAIHRIEAFDNSHIHGADPVAAMVVFVDGKPERSSYRKYKLQTAGGDDYGSMKEVITRRYRRVLDTGTVLPDLIVVDGGPLQIHAAREALGALGLSCPVLGLAKDDRHRTHQAFFNEDPQPLPLDPHAAAFLLLTRIQDEVHRFAITFHRNRHNKQAMHSMLEEIPGVGPKRREQLLRHFGSVEAIATATIDDFRSLGIGDKLAQRILDTLGRKTLGQNRPTARETLAGQEK